MFLMWLSKIYTDIYCLNNEFNTGKSFFQENEGKLQKGNPKI